MEPNKQIIENIDLYLNGKLNGDELQEFQKLMSSDSGIQNEVEFQKMIKDGLQNSRHLELKQRLNNIVIEPVFQWTAGKIASGLAILSLLTFSIYQFNNTEDKPINVAKNTVNVAAKSIEKIETNIENKPNIEVNNTSSIKVKSNQSIKNKITKKEKAISPVVEDVSQNVNIALPAMPSDFNLHHVDKNTHSNVPNGKIEQVGTVSFSTIIPIVENNKDKFHYKYYANKLVLVGDFSKGPYELIELNKNQEKNLYLHYDNSFYKLHFGTENLAHLDVLLDSKLIKELKNKIKK